MAQLALGLKNKSIAEKLTLSDTMVTSMTGNPNFTTPSPTLASVTTNAEAIRTKQAELEATKALLDTQTLELETLVLNHDDLLTTLGKYIEHITGGDATKMASSGAPLKGAATPIGELAAPANLRLTGGDQDGELDGAWDPRRGATTYLARYGTAPNGPWTQGYVGTASKCTLTGLTSGTEYYVQVCAVGAAGQSPWSDIARKRAT